ncbi:MAG: DUF4238 domain-containing protein [Proteobacteria bacterium]|nr:DUF4238 domain-containing protein [Pseudomonadota bacterium]MBU1740351.1 DUF4238 domain-containing protein [Pseudomonadota bacterium]
MTRTSPSIQHYVPQFILKNFGVGNKRHIFVFDKWEEKVFKSSAKSIGGEKGFYNFMSNGDIITIEPSLAKLESLSAKIVKRIIREESLSNIAEEERVLLSQFLAVQFRRTKGIRQDIESSKDALVSHLKKLGVDPESVISYTSIDAMEIKKMSIKMLIDSDQILPYFYDKSMVVNEDS